MSQPSYTAVVAAVIFVAVVAGIAIVAIGIVVAVIVVMVAVVFAAVVMWWGKRCMPVGRQVKAYAGGSNDKYQQAKHKPGARRLDGCIKSKMKCQSVRQISLVWVSFVISFCLLSFRVSLLVLASSAAGHRP